VILIHQRHRQTDGQTDRRTDRRTTCNLNTALCTSASRGKKSENDYKYVWHNSLLSLLLQRRETYHLTLPMISTARPKLHYFDLLCNKKSTVHATFIDIWLYNWPVGLKIIRLYYSMADFMNWTKTLDAGFVCRPTCDIRYNFAGSVCYAVLSECCTKRKLRVWVNLCILCPTGTALTRPLPILRLLKIRTPLQNKQLSPY